jgi:hypothetical protein
LAPTWIGPSLVQRAYFQTIEDVIECEETPSVGKQAGEIAIKTD